LSQQFHDPVSFLFLQANVWTEYVQDEPTCEYMLLPRMCAMAEVLWSPPTCKDWDSFLGRLPTVLAHFDAVGLRYRPLGGSSDEAGALSPLAHGAGAL